jgi:GNAT superfamily N-acetyltransferase
VLSHREVLPGDVAAICAFPQSAEELYFLFPRATFPLTPAQLHRSMAQRFGATVVLDDGKVCGFANLFRKDGTAGCAIGNVIVAPDARARGVGRYLIETMVRTALALDPAGEVRISCFNRNVAGLLLYGKLGFVPFAVEQRLDPLGARVALIHLRLSDEARRRLG